MAITRGELDTRLPSRTLVVGSFAMGTDEGQAAQITQAIAAGGGASNVTLTDDSVGISTLSYESVADGTAKSNVDMVNDGGCAVDTVFEIDVGGVAGNNWTMTLVSGAGAGDGLSFYSDATNNRLVCMYEEGISTWAQFEAAIPAGFTKVSGTGGAGALAAATDTCYNIPLTGGTAVQWAEEAAGAIVLHYTDASTTGAQALAAINAISGGSATATGGGANIMAAPGDTQAAANFQDAAPIGYAADAASTKGEGFTVSKGAVGTFYITMDDVYEDCESYSANLQTAVADQTVQGLQWDQTNNRFEVTVFDHTLASLADPALAATTRINFRAVMKETSGN